MKIKFCLACIRGPKMAFIPALEGWAMYFKWHLNEVSSTALLQWQASLTFGSVFLQKLYLLDEGQVTHIKMSRLLNVWKQIGRKIQVMVKIKTHQILRKFCLGQNKRGFYELNLLPVDNTSKEAEFYFNCLICCWKHGSVFKIQRSTPLFRQ